MQTRLSAERWKRRRTGGRVPVGSLRVGAGRHPEKGGGSAGGRRCAPSPAIGQGLRGGESYAGESGERAPPPLQSSSAAPLGLISCVVVWGGRFLSTPLCMRPCRNQGLYVCVDVRRVVFCPAAAVVYLNSKQAKHHVAVSLGTLPFLLFIVCCRSFCLSFSSFPREVTTQLWMTSPADRGSFAISAERSLPRKFDQSEKC